MLFCATISRGGNTPRDLQASKDGKQSGQPPFEMGHLRLGLGLAVEVEYDSGLGNLL